MSYIHNFMYIATYLEQVTFIVKPIITRGGTKSTVKSTTRKDKCIPPAFGHLP